MRKMVGEEKCLNIDHEVESKDGLNVEISI